MAKILITGAAGFIGHFLVKKLVSKKENIIVGIDSLNDYYDRELKISRLKNQGIEINKLINNEINSDLYSNYKFIKINIEEKENLNNIFENEAFEYVIHLAAQAGVRYSISHPYTYINSNIYGFINILESCRNFPVKHLVYASSSSVYGLNSKQPFSTLDKTDSPISLYAATKKSNELMAHTYSYLYNIPCTGLRFFTVYGPWGRPDMAYFIFTKSIFNDEPINVFNNGHLKRDFTYIDDIIDGINKIYQKPPNIETLKNQQDLNIPFKIYNIGNNKPINIKEFISTLEKIIGRKATINYLPMQLGDVKSTYANIDPLINDFNFHPKTNIYEGLKNFIEWYKKYYDL